jgi:hypothetical protein
MYDEDRWEVECYGASVAPPARPRNDASGKWQYFRMVCTPNAAREGRWEWTPEEVTARASAELGLPVKLQTVGTSLTKLQNKEGLLLQRCGGDWTAPSGRTHRVRLYLPTPLGRAVAKQMGLPREDRPGPPSEHGRLPADLVLRVLAALPLAARARAACVCRAWRALAATPSLWAEVDCSESGTTREHALAAVARAGGALRSLHAGVDVLSAADLVRLLCGGACPALERLTTATATSEGALDFGVRTARAILAACPALRTLNCQLGADQEEDETGVQDAQDGAWLLELCAFLAHPAVRCETLLFDGQYEYGEEREAVRAAVDGALRAQAPWLTRLVVYADTPWLGVQLGATLPALRVLRSVYFTRGLPPAVAGALGAVPSLVSVHADVADFEAGTLENLATSLAQPACGVKRIMFTPHPRDTPPPFVPPPRRCRRDAGRGGGAPRHASRHGCADVGVL